MEIILSITLANALYLKHSMAWELWPYFENKDTLLHLEVFSMMFWGLKEFVVIDMDGL